MTLIVLDEPHRVIHHWIEAAGANETGGLLIGWRRQDLGMIVVTLATGPGRRARATSRRLELDVEDLQVSVDQAFNTSEGAETYLGDWHLHHEAEPRPSNADRRAVVALARAPEVRAPEPVLLIVGTGDTSMNWRAWEGPLLHPLSVQLRTGTTSAR